MIVDKFKKKPETYNLVTLNFQNVNAFLNRIGKGANTFTQENLDENDVEGEENSGDRGNIGHFVQVTALRPS
ncbi:4561_t:CDS:2 [Ambispora gerdemannii]|uniref:4561_t:CDS:1 n=1 Tax=Ambispora gerdemannii TaxID=144530 RepID=A0A9N8VTK1_9GLOM|nr:4561_t:CDS:2 [Ambispora gerdemannii]